MRQAVVSIARCRVQIRCWLIAIFVRSVHVAFVFNANKVADPDQRWRNWGIGWAYIGFNIFGAVALYYAFRVKHYNPTSIVRGVCNAGSFVGRMFKRKSEAPKGQKAQDGRVF